MTFPSADPVLSRNLAERNAIIRTLDNVKAIAEFGTDGTLLHANSRFLTIFGYQLDEVLGAHHRLFCDAAYASTEGYRQFWNRLRSGVAYTDLCERRLCDGRSCWLEATYAPIFDAEGRVVRILKMAGDVTARVERDRQVQEETRRLSLVADATDNAVLITDGDWRVVYVNRGFTRMFGFTPEEAMGQVPPEMLAPHLSRDEIAGLLTDLRARNSHRREELLVGRHGGRHWCSISCSPVLDERLHLINTVSVITDITQSKMHQVLQHRVLEAIATERSLREIATMVCEEVDRVLPDAASCVVEIDATGRIQALAAPQLPGDYLALLSSQSLTSGMNTDVAHRAMHDGVFVNILSDPDWRVFKGGLTAAGFVAFWAMPIRTLDGAIVGAVAFHYRELRRPDDFHRRLMEACGNLCALALERERSRTRIRKLAYYDVLTQLPNRSLLHARAEQALASAQRDGVPAAVLFVDLDRFKHVNDSLGHPAGDELLKLIATRLAQGRRASDIVSRLSGDEFVMVLPGCDAPHAAETVEQIQAVLRQPAEIGAVDVQPSASIGIAMFPADGDDMQTLLHRADMAMYQAKSVARGSSAFFSSALNAHAQDRLAFEADLRAALASDGLDLHYQPQVELATGRLHGVEVLARWTHPTRGEVPPGRFIPVAEDCGAIDLLTRFVLTTACAQLGAWRREGLRIPALSINFSPLTLHDRGLPQRVRDTLHAHGLVPSDLVVEITEGVMLEQHSSTMQTIRELDEMGVQLSMDDFGTGYSSLSYLHSLPITELKLDRSFVADLGSRDSALPLSRAVVQIGISLGLTVVAEGVETEAQRRLLAEQGCHVAQGWLFSRPLTAQALRDWSLGRGDALVSHDCFDAAAAI